MARGKTRARDGIYTRRDRPGFFASWIDASGRRRQRKLEAHTLEQARALLAAEKARVEKSRTLGYAPPSQEKFADVGERFLKYQKARLTRNSYAREKGIVNSHLIPFFERAKLHEIRRRDVQRYITQRSGAVSAGSVVKELNVLKHILGLAVDWELIPLNPAHGVKPPRVPPGRVRYLQPRELQMVLAACPEWLRPVALLAAATGMRRGEILGLRWLDIDVNGRRILLPRTKNGEGRIVYLNGLAQRVIAAAHTPGTATTDLVFNHRELTPSNASLTFLRACRSVGISDFRFHDLRHTAASWMRMRGADIHTVAQVLGHKDLRMAARYQHLSPAFLAEAVGLLDQAYGELKSPSSPEEAVPVLSLPQRDQRSAGKAATAVTD